MDVFYDFRTSATASISAAYERYETSQEIEFHMHKFYEFAMIHRGTCTHKFRGVEVPLIAGDIVLIPPCEGHAYSIHSYAEITNCYFFPERIGESSTYITSHTLHSSSAPLGTEDLKNQWDNLLSSLSLREEDNAREPQLLIDNLTKQGVLHLPPEIALDVEGLLGRLYDEDQNQLYDVAYMKSAILQMILVIFQRTRLNIPQKAPRPPEHKKEMILGALIYIENHYTEPLTIQRMADQVTLSVSYFRTIFKEVTGMSPLDYLNRIRIIKALEYLSSDDMPVAEAAARVGIYDSNYFTRLFKKIIGYPPRYFKRIADSAAEGKS